MYMYIYMCVCVCVCVCVCIRWVWGVRSNGLDRGGDVVGERCRGCEVPGVMGWVSERFRVREFETQ